MKLKYRILEWLRTVKVKKKTKTVYVNSDDVCRTDSNDEPYKIKIKKD